MLTFASTFHGGPGQLPDWLRDILSTGLGVVGYIIFVLVLLIITYFATLAYGWLPMLLLKRKRHLLWLLPIVSVLSVFGLVFLVGETSDDAAEATWLDYVIFATLVVVPAGAAFFAGATLVGINVLIRHTRALSDSPTDAKHTLQQSE